MSLARSIILAGILVLSACAADPRPAPMTPDKVLEAPPGVAPQSMNFAVQPLPDQDRDGWPDVIPVIVYLFSTDSAQPRRFDGGFVFTVSDLDATVIQRWVVGPEDAPKAAGIRSGLTGYSFRLDLPHADPGEIFPDRVLIEARFVPMSGAPEISRRILVPFRLR